MLIPIDFNSLSQAENGKIKLSDYYIDYAFTNEGIHPANGMEITFYAENWTPNPTEIICLGAILRKSDGSEAWLAELKGRIYTLAEKPNRKYFSAFIGANTQRMAGADGKIVEQKIGDDPANNKLANVSCFMFAKGSPLPDFSQVIGMDAEGLHNFFQFPDCTKPIIENGKYRGDTLLVRGGSNRR